MMAPYGYGKSIDVSATSTMTGIPRAGGLCGIEGWCARPDEGCCGRCGRQFVAPR